jgi:hypothetical protein
MPRASAPRSCCAPLCRARPRAAWWWATSGCCGARRGCFGPQACRWRCCTRWPTWPTCHPTVCRCFSPPGLPAGLDSVPWGGIDARCGAAAAACITAAVALGAGRAPRRHRHRTHPQGGAGGRRRRLPRPHRDAAGAGGPGGPLPPVRMMLANDELRVVLVTIHVALRKAIDAVDLRRRAADAAHHPRAVPAWAGGRRASRWRAESACRRRRAVR